MEETPGPRRPMEAETASEQPPVYPPKYENDEAPANPWIKSVSSLALYLILGYFIFPSYKMLLLITIIVVIHEMGHFLAMKFYGYGDLGIFFIPLLGAYVSGTKREVSQKQSAIILLAGPLPGIILGIAFYFLHQYSASGYYPFNISLHDIGLFFLILNLLNLLPIYPLDGGQLLNRVFLDEEGIMSKIYIFLSAALMCWAAWQLSSSGNLIYLLLLLFPAMMLLRMRTDKKLDAVEKKIEESGINADIAYEDMPDEDYWRMRNILIEDHPAFKDIPKAPPYEYSDREDKVMTTIQSLLHRHIIEDLSIAGKIFIFIIWVAALTSPWLLRMDFNFRFVS
jgi:Zn-dependent protease